VALEHFLETVNAHNLLCTQFNGFPGCSSFGVTQPGDIGTLTPFLAPVWAMSFHWLQLRTAAAIFFGGCRAGFRPGGAGLPQVFLEVSITAGVMSLRGLVVTTGCGTVPFGTTVIPDDLVDDHSAILTYDEGGDFHLYMDNVQVATGPSPCPAVLSIPDAGRNFVVQGNTAFSGLNDFAIGQVIYATGVPTSAQRTAWSGLI
jgi:hypothetical protein